MPNVAPAPSSPPHAVCIVTGANTGLGLGIVYRYIDEFFLKLHPNTSHTLTVCITTRSSTKATATLALINARTTKCLNSQQFARLTIDYILLDLCSLHSVSSAAKEFNKSYKHVDHFFCNAGMGAFTGIDWFKAIWEIVTRFLAAVTSPSFKMQATGVMTTAHKSIVEASDQGKHDAQKAQVDAAADGEELGAVFCANVFGHYYLLHEIMALLRTPKIGEISSSNQDNNDNNDNNGQVRKRSRIIWVSSLEAYRHAFNMDDFQGIRSPISYEASKRLTDILALSYHDASAYDSFTKPEQQLHLQQQEQQPQQGQIHTESQGQIRNQDQQTVPQSQSQSIDSIVRSTQPPLLLLVHPGIVATSMFELPSIVLVWATMLMFHVARLVGSPWHSGSTYKGAVAPIWAALSASDHEAEERGKKYGSGSDRWAVEKVINTEVEAGWEAGDGKGLGEEVWMEMERLRKLWRRRIEK